MVIIYKQRLKRGIFTSLSLLSILSLFVFEAHGDVLNGQMDRDGSNYKNYLREEIIEGENGDRRNPQFFHNDEEIVNNQEDSHTIQTELRDLSTHTLDSSFNNGENNNEEKLKNTANNASEESDEEDWVKLCQEQWQSFQTFPMKISVNISNNSLNKSEELRDTTPNPGEDSYMEEWIYMNATSAPQKETFFLSIFYGVSVRYNFGPTRAF